MAGSSQDRQRFVGDLGHIRLVMSITGSWRSDEGVCWPGRLPGSARSGRRGRRGGRPAQARPSSSVTTSTTERALPSSAVQVRCRSRPTTTTRLPFESDSTACSAWSRHTTTVKNDASCSRPTARPGGAGVHRSHGRAAELGPLRQAPRPTSHPGRERGDRQAAQGSATGPLPERLRFYDPRHTYASLLIAQGASVKAVQAQLGHATASITLDTYGYLLPSEMATLGHRLELVRDAAGTDPARTTGQRPGRNHRSGLWRRLRGSNPRGSCPPTRFPGVCLRPLGQASAGQCTPRGPRSRRAGRRGG
jgi:hypothetical protein